MSGRPLRPPRVPGPAPGEERTAVEAHGSRRDRLRRPQWHPPASGCGNADVAATFDGHTVTEGEVDAAVKEINEAFQPQQPYTADNALSALIRAPYLIDYAIKQGKPQTESAARAAISIHDPSESTVRIVQSTAVIDGLTDTDRIALTKTFNDLKVDVNPKYGAYDPAQAAVGPSTPSWLEFSADNG